MTRYINLKDLRPKLSLVMNAVDQKLERYVVTKRGQPIAVVISNDDYESMLETFEVMSDADLVKRLKRAEKDAKAGKKRSLDAIERDLGL